MPAALLDRMSTEHELATQVLPYVAPPASVAVGWVARNWWTSRRDARLAKVKEAAIDRTAARVERADLLDRLATEVEHKDARIAQLERDVIELRQALGQLQIEVARYQAGLVAPHSYVLVPRAVVEAIRATHPGSLPAIYPGEETPA